MRMKNGRMTGRAARKVLRMSSLAALLAVVLFAAGCTKSRGEEPVARSFFAMDTIMEMAIYGDEAVAKDAEDLVRELENKFSATTGEVARLNKANENGKLENREGYSDLLDEERFFELSTETGELIEKALKYSQWTNGALDIAIYPITQLYGFDTGNYRVPSEEEISSLLKITGSNAVYLRKGNKNEYSIGFHPKVGPDSGLRGAAIDLGCIAKGYTGDKLAEFFESRGVKSALLNLGGNVCAIGTKPDGSLWRVGIANPKDTSSQIGYVDIKDCSVVTSGTYQRFFEKDGKRYHHILDAKTGKPVNNGLSSVTVIGRDGAMCDALSTALFVTGADKAMEVYRKYSHYEEINIISSSREPRANFEKNILVGGFEVIFVFEDGTVGITEGLKGIFEPIGVNPVVMK